MRSNDEKRNTLAERIREALAARREQADEEYGKSVAAASLEADGIFLHTVRRYTAGVEPQWLIRAKQLHDELGRYIYVLSQRHRMDMPNAVLKHAEVTVKLFVDSQAARIKHDRLNAMTFLAVVNMVVRRDSSVCGPIDDGMPSAEVVCFTYSIFDPDLAMRLAQHADDVSLLLERWLDDTPRKPTKWSVASELWKKAIGKSYSSDTWRRWDPRKKQVLPRRGRKPGD